MMCLFASGISCESDKSKKLAGEQAQIKGGLLTVAVLLTGVMSTGCNLSVILNLYNDLVWHTQQENFLYVSAVCSCANRIEDRT